MPKITDRVNGYANMTAEEKLKALESLDDAFSTADETKYKNLISQANSEASKYKKEWLATKEEAEQKAILEKEEKEKIAKELAEYKEKERIATYKAKLLSLGYSEEESAEMATGMPSELNEVFWANMSKMKQTMETKIKNELLKNAPRPTIGGTGTATKTKEEILAIKDTLQRQKAISENIELFQ